MILYIDFVENSVNRKSLQAHAPTRWRVTVIGGFVCNALSEVTLGWL